MPIISVHECPVCKKTYKTMRHYKPHLIKECREKFRHRYRDSGNYVETLEKDMADATCVSDIFSIIEKRKWEIDECIRIEHRWRDSSPPYYRSFGERSFTLDPESITIFGNKLEFSGVCRVKWVSYNSYYEKWETKDCQSDFSYVMRQVGLSITPDYYLPNRPSKEFKAAINLRRFKKIADLVVSARRINGDLSICA